VRVVLKGYDRLAKRKKQFETTRVQAGNVYLGKHAKFIFIAICPELPDGIF
jgi:hypothetical protein